MHLDGGLYCGSLTLVLLLLLLHKCPYVHGAFKADLTSIEPIFSSPRLALKLFISSPLPCSQPLLLHTIHVPCVMCMTLPIASSFPISWTPKSGLLPPQAVHPVHFCALQRPSHHPLSPTSPHERHLCWLACTSPGSRQSCSIQSCSPTRCCQGKKSKKRCISRAQ